MLNFINADAALSNSKVGSVSKALKILNCFDQSHSELSLNDFHKALSIPKSTLSNLLSTLEDGGYVVRSKRGQCYHLGYKTLELAYFMRSSIPIRQYALPLMEDLQSYSNENIYLTTYVSGRVLYLEALYPSKRKSKYSISGKTLPMHCTSCGKAMLSYLPEDEVEEIIARWGLPAVTQNTITDHDKLMEQLRIDRIRGYSVDVEEESVGVKCVAVAIRDDTGRAVGALSISGSVLSITDELVLEYASELIKTCNILSTYSDLFL